MTNETLQRVQVDGVEIAFRDVGQGSPIVFFHGGEGDHRVYDILQDLLAADFRGLSFDQRDCGQTRFIGPEPDAYALSDIAADGIRLLDALGLERATFAGFSLGGLLCQVVASRWPSRVERIVAGVTWPGGRKLQDLNPEGLRRRAELSQQGEASDRLLAEFMSTPAFVQAHPEIVEQLRDLRTMPSEAARQRRFNALAVAEPVNVAAITCPTLVVAAEFDQLVPPEVTAGLAELIAGARLVTVPNAGHLATRQEPQLIATLIKDFLHER